MFTPWDCIEAVRVSLSYYSCVVQDPCSCPPPRRLEQACTLWLSMEVWSCSACSSCMTHRRSSRRQRPTLFMVCRNTTPSTRKSLQKTFYSTGKRSKRSNFCLVVLSAHNHFSNNGLTLNTIFCWSLTFMKIWVIANIIFFYRCMGIYMDTLNIFMRLVMILANGGSGRRK